jgi:hypothetical protein
MASSLIPNSLYQGQVGIRIEIDHLSNVPAAQQVNLANLTTTLQVMNASTGTIIATYAMTYDSISGLASYYTQANDAFYNPGNLLIQEIATNGGGTVLYRGVPIAVTILET